MFVVAGDCVVDDYVAAVAVDDADGSSIEAIVVVVVAEVLLVHNIAVVAAFAVVDE